MFVSPKCYQLWPFTFHLVKIPIFILLSGIYIFQLQAEILPCVFTTSSFSTAALALCSLLVDLLSRKRSIPREMYRLHRKDKEAAWLLASHRGRKIWVQHKLAAPTWIASGLLCL